MTEHGYKECYTCKKRIPSESKVPFCDGCYQAALTLQRCYREAIKEHPELSK